MTRRGRWSCSTRAPILRSASADFRQSSRHDSAALPTAARLLMAKLRDRVLLFSLAISLGCFGAGAGLADEPPSVPEIRPGALKGYLQKEAVPDSAALLPPPPAVDSAAAALGHDVARANLALRDSPRWRLAAMDADLQFPDAAGDSSGALGAPVTDQDTPRLLSDAAPSHD
jgi:hypothetical protein